MDPPHTAQSEQAVTAADILSETAADMRLPGESYCADCPDHEACYMGYPCDMVLAVARAWRGE